MVTFAGPGGLGAPGLSSNRMGAFDEYYRVLELEPGASPQEVKRAYRSLVKIWHPDHVSRHPALRRKSEEKMKRLNEAYEMLKDLDPGPLSRKSAPEEPPPPPPPEPEPPHEESDEPEEEPEEEEAPQEPAPGPWARLTGANTGLGGWGPRVKIRPRRPKRYPRGHPVQRLASLGKVAMAQAASIAAMLAFFYVNQPVEHPYYDLLRGIVFCSTLYTSFSCLVFGCEELLFLLLPIALLFNPVLPVAISFEEWFLFNALVPFILIFILVSLFRRGERDS